MGFIAHTTDIRMPAPNVGCFPNHKGIDKQRKENMMADASMTKKAFEEQYAHDSGTSTTISEMHLMGLQGVRCNCGHIRCKGWRLMFTVQQIDDKENHNASKKTP